MIDQQKQEVGSGSNAIQAKGDVIVHQGATPEQISEIIIALSKQLSHFEQEARTIAEKRCEEFRKDILSEFAKSDGSANSNAFKDPDYQHLLGTSLHEYARKGTEDLKSELVDLLKIRSNLETGSRLSLILNEAIELSPKLCKQDKDVLVTLFVIKNVHINSNNMPGIYHRYNKMLENHVSNLPTGTASFEYLQSLGCISTDRVADHWPLDDHFYESYKDTANSELSRIQVNKLDDPTPFDKDKLWSRFQENVPELKVLGDIWPSGFYRHSVTTATGRAIAHSILSGQGRMDAAMEVFFN